MQTTTTSSTQARMEKLPETRLHDPWEAPQQTTRRKLAIPRAFVNVLLAILVVDKVLYSASITSGVSSWFDRTSKSTIEAGWTDDIWAALPTLPYLDYQPCYTGFQCARLELPLDYFNGTTNATISLAVMRKPAAVPVTSPYYGDAIILNPGGPGGSGVQFLQGIGGALQTLVDSQEETEGAKYFDIISFDPRGIQYSSPNVRCFNNSRLYDSWVERISEEGSVTSSDAALGRLWSMSKASGASCALAGDEDIKRFVTTASVATDMIRLTEAHGAWREKEAKRLLAKSLGKHSAIIVPDRVKYKPSKELIQYWGFSYGTYLGATFASMYPGRIHRLILDGVVDAEDYAKALWYDNLEDTEKNINLFYYHCARVGPSGCALAEEGSTAGNIEAVVKKVIADLYHNPLPIVGPNPDVVTYSGVRMTILIATYSPLVQFPRLATFLAMIRDGQKQGYMLSDKSAPSAALPVHGENSAYANMAVACGDGDDNTNLTKAEFSEHVAHLEKLSPSVGALWSALRMNCAGWTIRPNHRYAGPWTGNTSHPILFIGNTADPVTPLGSAKKMSQGYDRSVVLTVDGPGHCSVAAISLQAIQYIKDYLHVGIMPPVGAVCQPDVVPFGEKDGEFGALSLQDRAALVAQAKIGESLIRVHSRDSLGMLLD